MKLFAISDLHLSTSTNKPMNIFGDVWEGHFDKIKKDWCDKVGDDDIVLLGGDMSWGLTLDEAEKDFDLLKDLKGTKVVLRGNHDYWWNSLSKIKNRFPDFLFLQNNAFKFENNVIAGSRGWNIPNQNTTEKDTKIFERELMRLELSLQSAHDKMQEGDTLIAVLHYPPFEAKFESTKVTDLLEKYKVDIATFGHLHGKNVRLEPQIEKNGIKYVLTSCDLIDNKLVELKPNN